jgi:rhodanese-related sulfurtransferase
VDQASRLTPGQVDEAIAAAGAQVVDLRNAGELAEGMLPGARHIPLAELMTRSGELEPDRPVVLYCAGGWRSSVGASFLRAKGFTDVSDILGGYGAWRRLAPVAS